MNMAFRNPSETLYPKNPLTNCSVLLPNGKDRLCRIACYEASDDCAAGIPCHPAKYTVPIHSGTA